MKVVLDPQEIRELCAEFARRCSSRAMATKTKTAKMNAKRRPANTAGMVLAHNHVAHDQGTPVGVNGFRAFFFHRRDLPHFVVCPCGWRRDFGKHYAAKGPRQGVRPATANALRASVNMRSTMRGYWSYSKAPGGAKKVGG